MTDFLDVHGLGPIDGEYAFDMEEIMGSFTYRELHKIKQIAGVRAGEIEDALVAGDSDVNLAFAIIILTRHGRRFNEDVLWDAPVDAGFTFRFAEREAAAEEDPTRPDTGGGPSSSSNGSGDDTTTVSESLGNSPRGTGSPGSARSAAYAPATSET